VSIAHPTVGIVGKVGVVVGMGLTVLPRSSVEVFGQFFRWLQQQRRLGHQQCI